MEMSKLQAYWQLTRMDRPIGSLLLLWPTLWALWIAAQGLPSWQILITFVLGVLLMRSAGCVINDFADRHVDGHVKRTVNRPLPSGKVTSREAIALFALLVLCAFALVMTLNWLTIQLSVVALALAAIYPFMKRVTHLPQLVLGLAFSWAIPMAFAAQAGAVSSVTWWLFAANVLWTIAYDTLYAMVDRDDDLKIGVKSSAILFGRFDKRIVGALQLLTLLILAGVGQQLQFHLVYFWALLFVGALFVYQQWLIRQRQREACFQAFLNNNYVGLVVFLGVALEYLLA
ncbi:4-hydroxybenzoate octaprenyltransferase [Vibrio stylophorae]|uniref:4-hydroxybenzoate octaprenyltransferase n=1 Tax=Vibrio stylophorae TaxID=659351 RepID=A0ABM8ZPV4_9VIBR|nr:4-hydroxybenzoate octaprenyltransferase [Vibrio stylophorae]CAH0532297.1 4-hydroxybenzoate octaprenyltransferase [Vibrio stylophorae]